MIGDLVRILVDAGATHASAARAATIIERGGSIRDAGDEIVIASEPHLADGQELVFEAMLERELVERCLCGKLACPECHEWWEANVDEAYVAIGGSGA